MGDAQMLRNIGDPGLAMLPYQVIDQLGIIFKKRQRLRGAGVAVILDLNLVLALDTFGVPIQGLSDRNRYTSSTSTTPGMAFIADALRADSW